MNDSPNIVAAAPILTKADPAAPALIITAPGAIAIRAGTSFAGVTFGADVPVLAPAEGYQPGRDYAVSIIDRDPLCALFTDARIGGAVLGGFHFAPGGNATARAGGDATPQINPCSIWDRNFRPACGDPRGMALVKMPGKPFWADIYLLCCRHMEIGTSAFGEPIADGDDPPQKPNADRFESFDYAAAVAALAYHGKQLMSFEEFCAATIGVTERSAAGRDPKVTGLDAPRTSRCGLMQATGNLWTWGHDGDPDDPRASIFGGSWFSGSLAGSRYALLDFWPEDSLADLGARGRCDHLQLD